jgi:WD40 repeat protein
MVEVGQRLSVTGLSSTRWQDLISCIDFSQVQTSAICYGDKFLAIGSTTGVIALYHATSLQVYRILNHGEAVMHLDAKSKSYLMASGGMETIRVWNTLNGQTLYTFQAPQQSICLAFICLTSKKNLLIAGSQKNCVTSWDLDNDGTQEPE